MRGHAYFLLASCVKHLDAGGPSMRGPWSWVITYRRYRWHFTLLWDEEESPSKRWSNDLNKGALKAAASLEEPVVSPHTRSSWKLEDTEEPQVLNPRFEPTEAAHIVLTSSHSLSDDTFQHVAPSAEELVVQVKPSRNFRCLCDSCLCVFSISDQWRTISPVTFSEWQLPCVKEAAVALPVGSFQWLVWPTHCTHVLSHELGAGDEVVLMLRYWTPEWLYAPCLSNRSELFEWVEGIFEKSVWKQMSWR